MGEESVTAFILEHILSPFWPYIAGAGVIIAGWFAARRGGVQAQKAKQAEDRVETMEKANEVRSAIDAKSDAAVRGDLGKWVRPD